MSNSRDRNGARGIPKANQTRRWGPNSGPGVPTYRKTARVPAPKPAAREDGDQPVVPPEDAFSEAITLIPVINAVKTPRRAALGDDDLMSQPEQPS